MVKQAAVPRDIVSAAKRRQASPIRLTEGLIRTLTAEAKLNKRSLAKHVEYLVAVGKAVEREIGTEDIIDIQSGLATVEVVRVNSPRIEPGAIRASVARQRKQGDLKQQVSTARLRYQASASHPGLLERIDKKGCRTLGNFINGKFIPADSI